MHMGYGEGVENKYAGRFFVSYGSCLIEFHSLLNKITSYWQFVSSSKMYACHIVLAPITKRTFNTYNLRYLDSGN